MDNNIKNNFYFSQLVLSIHTTAWAALGKIPNPISGKIEKNLEIAKVNIDILDMLLEKTKGNLSKDEEKFLKENISNLKINYIEELNKGKEEDKQNQQQENKINKDNKE